MEIQGKYVKNMRKYKGTIIVLIVCMIFAYLYAHVDKKEYFYNRTVDVEKYANTGVICISHPRLIIEKYRISSISIF